MRAPDNHHKKSEVHGHSASGIYIHFPFCRSRCPYCSFCSYSEDAARHVYHEYLLGEIDQISNVFREHFNPVDTIYFGGGTPSLMPVYAVDEILARLRTSVPLDAEWKDIEVSMEFNPEDLDPGYLEAMRGLGVNRISLGFQRMDDERLKFLHRLHSTEDNIKGSNRRRGAGSDKTR